MDVWFWLGVYLVGFVLLQLYLYRYFVRGSSSAESGRPEPTDVAGSGADIQKGEVGSQSGDESVTICVSCGTQNRNEAMFTYCKQCGSVLE